MAIAVELSKGPIVYALQKYDFFVIHPVNPTTLAKYRKAFNPSGAKDDPTGQNSPWNWFYDTRTVFNHSIPKALRYASSLHWKNSDEASSMRKTGQPIGCAIR